MSSHVTLQEPISQAFIHVYKHIYLGGGEENKRELYIQACYPEPTILQLDSLANMVFILEYHDSTKPNVLVQMLNGSDFKPLVTDMGVYGGLCLKRVDELTFIELKETVNAEALKRINWDGGRMTTEARKDDKGTEPAETQTRA